LMYLLYAENNFVAIGYYILVFYIFIVASFGLGYKQLTDLVEIQITATREKDHLKKFINAVPGYVSLLDRDLKYLEANEMTLRFFPTIIGSSVGEINGDTDYAKFVEQFSKSDKDREVKEIKVSVKERIFHFMVSIQKMANKNIVIVSIPMDELVKAREDLRVQEGKAQYSAKLASLGEMAAGIAHEVNNPLTIIQGSALIIESLVDQENVDIENVKLLTSKLVTTSERISKTIKSLKALSRNGDKDPFEKISLEYIFNQCLDVCRQRCTNYEIELILPSFPDEVFFVGREVQISQVLVNLLNNAIDAVKSVEGKKWIEISYEKTDKRIDLFVSDSGLGIAVEIQAKIMEPFFTTKEINQGTGLGLSISKNIIESHGGELSLLKTRQNTTFRIRLPQFAPGHTPG
jgi:C4-dicarboxylate-specific signal transduction histidine kinase